MKLSQQLKEQRNAHLEAVENFWNNPGGTCTGPKDECFPDTKTITAVDALEAEIERLTHENRRLWMNVTV